MEGCIQMELSYIASIYPEGTINGIPYSHGIIVKKALIKCNSYRDACTQMELSYERIHSDKALLGKHVLR